METEILDIIIGCFTITTELSTTKIIMKTDKRKF